jgi:CDP-glucose 4,6-dehydratase
VTDWLDFFHKRRVLITGHTGFKGGWLAVWLKQLGSDVTGIALKPDPAQPSFFDVAAVAEGINSIIVDIRDREAMTTIIKEAAPEIVFHLAAQPLVLASYDKPVETFMINVMGTVNVLDVLRDIPSVISIVNVTSDKSYENQGLERGYRECDRIGGSDPYSASKAAAELVTSSYRDSFFSNGLSLASARSGNVIGGGDWAANRLVPDLVRAFAKGGPVEIRNPDFTRPWQYVLEPLAGYLKLAYSLATYGQGFAGGWNFGPDENDRITVEELVSLFVQAWGIEGEINIVGADRNCRPRETEQLSLDATKARQQLGWRPLYSIQEGVSETVEWYRAFYDKHQSMSEFTVQKINAYSLRLRAL